MISRSSSKLKSSVSGSSIFTEDRLGASSTLAPEVPEQAEIAGAMAGVFDPQLMAETVNFTYGWHTADNREGMIRFLRGILPEEAFSGLTSHLKSNNADSWREIERRIPDL